METGRNNLNGDPPEGHPYYIGRSPIPAEDIRVPRRGDNFCVICVIKGEDLKDNARKSWDGYFFVVVGIYATLIHTLYRMS